MKTLVFTSDSYRFLIPSFCDYYGRVMKDYQDVTILGYAPLTEAQQKAVPYKYVSLGEQPPNKDWTSGLIPWFKEFDDDFFMLFLDDYYLYSCDTKLMEQAVKIMKADKLVMKFDLTTDRMKFPHIETENCNIIHSAQNARYRSSLQAAIWRTKYFKKLLVPKRTAWQFELAGEKECMNDGALILGTKTGIVQYHNKCLKGKLDQ